MHGFSNILIKLNVAFFISYEITTRYDRRV